MQRLPHHDSSQPSCPGGRLSLWLVLACLLTSSPILTAVSAPAQYPEMERARRAGAPNIILILADDLGYGDLGCYGQPRIRTPNLDRMAAEGMRFTQCYAGSAISAPSRAILLTGLHPSLCPVKRNSTDHLAPADPTIASLMQRAGYRTGAIGKWALGNHSNSATPNHLGFDEWLGYLEAVQAQDYYPPRLSRNANTLDITGNRYDLKTVYAPDLFTQSAIRFITNFASNPFFLYLAYPTPHANVPLGRLTGNGMQVPDTAPYTQENWPAPEKAKAAMITRLDSDIGRILQTLDDLRIATNTIIFFTSDNGPHNEGGVNPAFFQSAGPLRGLKHSLYEGGLRVPMIARWRGHIPQGTISTQVWSFVDVLPTCTALAKTGLPRNLNGTSILPTLLGSNQVEPAQPIYWELHEPVFQQALRLDHWKAIRTGTNQPVELYNLATDPAESTDLATQHPDIAARLTSLLDALTPTVPP